MVLVPGNRRHYRIALADIPAILARCGWIPQLQYRSSESFCQSHVNSHRSLHIARFKSRYRQHILRGREDKVHGLPGDNNQRDSVRYRIHSLHLGLLVTYFQFNTDHLQYRDTC